MKTIYRFILKSYLGPMVLTFFIVMFVLIMQFLWLHIDELVGKGLGVGVILELVSYAAICSIPMGLPLATLLAAIMTLGNLGENYELLAMKSAGMSLPKITRPLVFVVGIVCVISFFVANNMVPYAWRKTFALIYDIKNQKQSIDFKDGVFFNGIDENLSIRVGHQNPQTKLLTDVLIYDNRNFEGKMSTTRADSGYIFPSADMQYLMVILYHGETYEETRNYQWYDENVLRRHIFQRQEGKIPLSGFALERTPTELFTSGQTLNMVQLEEGMDSLYLMSLTSSTNSYRPLLKTYVFTRDSLLLRPVGDSLRAASTHIHKTNLLDSVLNLGVRDHKQVLADARSLANSSRSLLSFEEEASKEVLNQLYRYRVEWHRKIALPISIMIFFLIGASLGAIIRKGGLGMPIVISVVFFVIYYIISITGEKLAREGTWSAFAGVWISTFILFPLSVFLTYKATNDSNLLNAEWYYIKFKKIISYFQKNGKKIAKQR